MAERDAFADLARYYDAIMASVDYDRWLLVATALAELLPGKTFRHLDIGCGTGILTKRLVQHGWDTTGIDLSPAMAAGAIRGEYAPDVAIADMRALPFATASFDYATCLFDSLNFVLDEEGMRATVREAARVLADDGLYYFDLITQRMVTEHFEGQQWIEKNGKFTTTWESVYDRKTGIAETSIRVNKGQENWVRERVYPLKTVESALRDGGLTLLGVYDAENWKRPARKTIRMDVIAAKRDTKDLRKRLAKVEADVRAMLR